MAHGRIGLAIRSTNRTENIFWILISQFANLDKINFVEDNLYSIVHTELHALSVVVVVVVVIVVVLQVDGVGVQGATVGVHGVGVVVTMPWTQEYTGPVSMLSVSV